ncbi:hypothetical protein EUBVEN_00451 [Eubacterium ventriosum ATCC 27560]|uniref:Uncharacterized protein n=1 Tax=Eubacterium ventriosum ATCC 27560 TaxID=411463 RepID=A5Z446_9FIRM|nr:hypothetical protein EUBVEN_00451 [Eubacterium ventriosum ATCC 27560]
MSFRYRKIFALSVIAANLSASSAGMALNRLLKLINIAVITFSMSSDLCNSPFFTARSNSSLSLLVLVSFALSSLRSTASCDSGLRSLKYFMYALLVSAKAYRFPCFVCKIPFCVNLSTFLGVISKNFATAFLS